MRLPKQAKSVMRKVGTVNHFGLGIRPAACPPGVGEEMGTCELTNHDRARSTCPDCCGSNGIKWEGDVTGPVDC